MRKLFDTTFLVHYLTRPSQVETYLDANDTPENTFLASAISMKELAVGLHHLDDDSTIANLTADFQWLDVLPFTTRHAFHAGHIESYCREQGLPQERINSLGGDILIGGVARAEDAAVVSRNLDDLELIPGVTIEDY